MRKIVAVLLSAIQHKDYGMPEDEKKVTPGPEADRLKIDEDWESAVKKALNKPKPAEGWPEDADAEKPQGDDK